MPISIPDLIEKIDLPTLVESRAHIQLHRNGYGYNHPCPIHHGDNPTAFSVYQQKDGAWRWHCFTGCQTGGDALDFLRAISNLEFKDALIELAGYAHVSLDDLQLKTVDIQAETNRRITANVFSLATDVFKARLWSEDGADALAYLHSRGLADQTIRITRLGFTRSDYALYNNLLVAHQKSNSTGADLASATLCGLVRSDGADFTANAQGQVAAPNGYIVFPHLYGERVSYFSSRAVELPGFERPNPKDKSRNLPGPRQPYRCEIHQSSATLLVEGPMDALAIYQTSLAAPKPDNGARPPDLYSAWALCGLGELTPPEISALKRHSSLAIALDNDPAGESAASRPIGKMVDMITALGPLTMIIQASIAISGNDGPGKDFADLLKAGALTLETIKDLLASASTWLEYRLSLAADSIIAEQNERNLQIGRLLANLPEAIRSPYIRKAQAALGMSKKDVDNLMRMAIGNGDSGASGVKEGYLCFMGRPMGNFSARISHELQIFDGTKKTCHRYTLTGALATGQPLNTVEIDAEEFPSLDWIGKYWGARPILYSSKSNRYETVRAIQEISAKEMVRETVYTCTGWVDDVNGHRAYLTASGALSADGLDPSIRVDLGPNNLRHYALPNPPAGEELITAGRASLDFLAITTKRSITAALWCAVYAAPLSSIKSLNNLIWVYGQTQSGKSTITHLALSHMGPGFIDGRSFHSPAEWIDTAVSLEIAMFMTKDTLTVIDDYAPNFASLGESKKLAERSQHVIRSVGNRSSRGRGTTAITQRESKAPRGLVISTAENPILGQGIVGRTLYVPVDRGEVFLPGGNPRLDAAQKIAQAGVYAQAMAAYIAWLDRNWDTLVDVYPDLIEVASSQCRREHPELQNRQPDDYAILQAANLLAARCWYELGVISKVEQERLVKDNQAALIELIIGQAERVAAESPVKKFIESISSLLDRSLIYLAPSTLKDVAYVPPLHAELIGWYNPRVPDEVYLITDVCLQHAKEFWHDLDENMDVLPDALRRQVFQAGILARPEPGHVETVHKINGKPRRVLCLSNQKILDLYGVILANEATTGPMDRSDNQEEIPF